MPYHGIITVVLIITAVLLIALIIMSYGYFAANYRLLKLFGMYKCSPTKKIGSLWIDEKNKKWGCKTAQWLFDYSQIIDFDIQADGISLKKKFGFSQYGGDMPELAAKRCNTFERIVVVVIVDDNLQQFVNIPVGNSKTQEGSIEYEKNMRLANAICDELEKMRDNAI